MVHGGDVVSEGAALGDPGAAVMAEAPATEHRHAPASPLDPPTDDHCLFGHAGHCAQPALSAFAPDVDPLIAPAARPRAGYAVLPSKSLPLDPPPPRSA